MKDHFWKTHQLPSGQLSSQFPGLSPLGEVVGSMRLGTVCCDCSSIFLSSLLWHGLLHCLQTPWRCTCPVCSFVHPSLRGCLSSLVLLRQLLLCLFFLQHPPAFMSLLPWHLFPLLWCLFFPVFLVSHLQRMTVLSIFFFFYIRGWSWSIYIPYIIRHAEEHMLKDNSV